MVAALAAAALWAVLAWRSPSSTYHFAPMLVAAAWVVVEGTTEAGLTPRRIRQLALAGVAIAALVTVGLEVTGGLEGPVFWDTGDDAPVVVEHLLFAVIGALGGALVAARRAAVPSR